MIFRTLGRSGLSVSAIGMGCWAIGGPFWRYGQPVGWGNVNDADSIQAIHRALELGVTFFDTAAVYGCGHSERVLGQALQGHRSQVIIATKFGQAFIEETRQVTGYDTRPESIFRECEASLKRLGTDYIDLYQLHVKDVDIDQALIIRDALETLVASGKIRFYGWSTDDADRARFFADGDHCTAIQQRLNIFEGELQTLKLCESLNLASINRSPLGMGLLTGKFSPGTLIPDDDVRVRRPSFKENFTRELDRLDRISSVLTEDGRTLAQAAISWLWSRSPNTIPIPGFKNIHQVEENIAATDCLPFTSEQMELIDRLIA